MRIFASCREMHSEVKRDLHEMGIRVHPQTMQDMDVANDPRYETLELSPCVFTILDGGDWPMLAAKLRLDMRWIDAEIDERWRGANEEDGLNPGLAWTLREETWGPFIHDGKFAYTYSERFASRHWGESFPQHLLAKVIDELQERPDTRQGILAMWDPSIDTGNIGGVARVPCTMYYQFLRRRGVLDMFYTMRSSDFATHFPYDIILALCMQRRIANELGIEVGRFTFFTGSLHLYAKDADPGVF